MNSLESNTKFTKYKLRPKSNFPNGEEMEDIIMKKYEKIKETKQQLERNISSLNTNIIKLRS